LAAKDINKKLDDIFKECKKSDLITFENLAKEFDKQPTAVQSKKILKLSQSYKIDLVTSSEYANFLSASEKKKREVRRQQELEDGDAEGFDFLKEKELLEWSRSDSPVRMYLREMGKIPLLTKEEEVFLSREIEAGEDVILDAICSVPYLLDYILNYKGPLLNRERRVKELFKSFEDEKEEKETTDEKTGVVTTEIIKTTASAEKAAEKRVKQVVAAFKALEKAKKE